MWHLRRAFFLLIIVTLGLLLTYMTLMRATFMTQWKAMFVGEQETLVPALSWLPTSNTGQLNYWTEKEDPAVEELLQILQSRIQNFTVPKFNWTEKKCYENMTGASPCFDTTCPRQFPSSLRDRLQQMLSARATIPARYLQALASAAQPVTSHKYIFVTGASSNHYKEMQGLLYNLFYTLFPRMKGQDFALVVYNLGLSPREKELTEKHCRCTLIDFPFDRLPTFVQELKCFTWKPMIVASLLKKAEYVVWMDTSIRWLNSTPLFHFFQQARASSYLTRRNGKSIGVHTQASTARFFGDHLCQYTPFPQISAGFGFYYNDRIMREVILPLFLSCAFGSNCMCVKNYTQLFHCFSSTHQLVTCHRFDQSVISMIMAKLYMENMPELYAPRSAITIRRLGDSMNWFKSA